MASLDTRGVNTVNGQQGDVTTPIPGVPVFSTPVNSATVVTTPSGSLSVHIVNPAGALLALTIGLNNGTIDGQIHIIAFTKAITALSTTGTNIDTTIALLSGTIAGSAMMLVWSNATSKWIRCF